MQVARRHAEIANLDNDLQKYLVLSDLQARNETLFYAVLMSDPATYMPLVYTPTVGEACQKFDHIFRQARGIYLPISARGRMKEILGNWPEKDVRFIVVTDGERILGLGDLGVGGMGIPIGKLALYTACAGVPPQYCLPIVLDVGTNNETCSRIRSISGCASTACAARSTTAFVDEFVEAVRDALSEVLHPVGGFRQHQRRADPGALSRQDLHLQRRHPGHRGIALAGIFAALRITEQKLTDQRFLFLGGGSAGTGIAELISQAMALEGMDIAEARRRNALFDINGLWSTSRTDLADFQKPFAQDRAPISTFVEAVKALRPTAIIGVSTVPKLFTREVIEAMARSTSDRSSSRTRTRPRVRNARPRKPIAGPTAGPSSPAAARSRRSRSPADTSCPGKAIMSTFSRPWAWRCSPPRRSGSPRRCSSLRASGGRASDRREPRDRADLSAAEPHLRGLVARRRTDRRVYFRPGARADAGRRISAR